MGDARRNEVFAKFIFHNFPRAKTCLVVADGKGELALLLSRRYKIRVVENKPRQVTKRKRIKYTKGWFTWTSPVYEDFIVGMHPDEATGEIIRAAVRNKKKWAIVPCCIKGDVAHGIRGFPQWLKKLKSLARNYNETRLKFNGKNTVIWGN
jgi:hypothetical protein